MHPVRGSCRISAAHSADSLIFHTSVDQMKRKLEKVELNESIMAPGADHEGFLDDGAVDASTTVVIAGAGPSGLMLA